MAKEKPDQAIVILETPNRFTIGPASLNYGSVNGRETMFVHLYSLPNQIEAHFRNPSENNHWIAIEEGYNSKSPIVARSQQELCNKMYERALSRATELSTNWKRPIKDLTSRVNSGFERLSEDSSGIMFAQTQPLCTKVGSRDREPLRVISGSGDSLLILK